MEIGFSNIEGLLAGRTDVLQRRETVSALQRTM